MWKYSITNNFTPEHTVLVLNHTTEVWNPVKAYFPFILQKGIDEYILSTLNTVEKEF